MSVRRNTEAATVLSVRQKLLVKQFLPLAYKLAHRRYRRIGGAVELELLQSHAKLSLTLAALNYRNGRGATFMTYAHKCIWFNFLCDSTNDKLRRQVQHERLDWEDDEPRDLVDPRSPDPSDVYDPDPRLMRALRRLPPRERTVLERVIVQGEEIGAVGRSMGFSRQWARWILDLAIAKVRADLGDPEPLRLIRRRNAEKDYRRKGVAS